MTTWRALPAAAAVFVIAAAGCAGPRKYGFADCEKELDDNAFRDIALGQSYFGLLGLSDRAPSICKA
jgi:hypothetical protein